MTALLIATLLGADVHLGGAVGIGVGVPFRLANSGPVVSLKGFVDVGVMNKLTIGAVLPVSFGFYRQAIAFAAVDYTVVDVLPGARATYTFIDWAHAVLELGAGPSIYNVKGTVFGGTSSNTQTYFAMRVAALVEVHPPSLKGLFIWVEPLGLHARLDNSFSEYRLSVGAGYRL
ncbi:MAG: hypothetical protein JNK82_08260 [Myxococcaceae bacterium]|nr:hypothetical protein [Myxococcaceae bacterium]